MKGAGWALIALATIGAVAMPPATAPDIRRSWRMRSM